MKSWELKPHDFDLFTIDLADGKHIWAMRCYECAKVTFAPLAETLWKWKRIHRATCEMKRPVFSVPLPKREERSA